MKLAFVGGFGFRPKGTIQGRAFPLAAELVRLGHEVTIFVTPYDNLQESGRDWVEEGVRIKGIRTGSTRLSYPGLMVRLVHELGRYRPDIVHIFKPKGFAGAAGTYLQLKGRRSVVLDCDDWEGWGGWNDVKSYPWILKEYIDWQERWLMRKAPAVTVASRALTQRVLEARREVSGVFYIPNCANFEGAQVETRKAVQSITPLQTRRVLNLPDGPIILYSGHFEPGEDVAFFCRAAAQLAGRHHAAIVFVGDGPDLPKVREFFSNHPQVNLYFFPRLPFQDFLRVIWATDVAAFPYPDDPIHRAKCSARVIDYMAMGKPVITSAVGENNEYIVNGESGILVPPGDEPAFAAGLELLLQNPSLRHAIGQKASQRVREHFSWQGAPLKQCLAAYDQALSRN